MNSERAPHVPREKQDCPCKMQHRHQLPTILVVDDEHGLRQSLRMLLKEQYEVLLASSVAEAKEILAETPVDIIITDIHMPNSTGLDLLREVKKNHPEIEVIILTGYGRLVTAMEAIECGAFAYLEKPFDFQVMLDRIQACLERQRQENSRRAMEYLALEANRFETLGHLVSGTLHDLGTPLSVIGTHLEMLIRHPDKPGAEKRYEVMKAQLQHCNDLVRNTMNFVRQSRETRGTFSLNSVVEMCLSVARPFLMGRNIATVLDLNPGLSLCEGEVVLVRQALLNLIYNASQAMQDQEEPRQLRIQTWTEPGFVCLAVQDSGPGIPCEMKEVIFDTLYTTKGEKGTGLGLTVVKHVMQRHGGTVELDPLEGRGTRFVLRFPALQAV